MFVVRRQVPVRIIASTLIVTPPGQSYPDGVNLYAVSEHDPGVKL